MEPNEKRLRKIICSEEEVIEVDVITLSKLSPVIRNKLAMESEKSEEEQKIIVNNVTSLALEKIMDYCKVHVHLTSPRSNRKIDNIAQWDENFVKLEPGTLCELASAAYHLEVKPLVDLTCQAIAYLLKGKSPAEIRKTFNIPYDFSPEDDAPPPTVRDKLRNKLCYPKKKQIVETPKKEFQEDQRTVEELLNFINDTKNSKKKKKKKKKSSSKSTPNQTKSQTNKTTNNNTTNNNTISKSNVNNKNNINNTTNKNQNITKNNNNNNNNIQSKNPSLDKSTKNNNNNKIDNKNDRIDNKIQSKNKNNNNNNKNTKIINQNIDDNNNIINKINSKNGSDDLTHHLSLLDFSNSDDDKIDSRFDVDEEFDPEIEKEIEEFRSRLNIVSNNKKIALPSSLSQALVGLTQNK